MGETPGCSRRTRWWLRLQGALLLAVVLFAAVVIHYWPGTEGWATYFGYQSRVFHFGRESAYPLASPRNDLPGLRNFAKVSRNLYRGAAADRMGYAELKVMGVRTIVDLREAHSDLPHLQGLGLRYVHITANPSELDDEEVADVLHVLRNPDYQPCFIHCTAGADRTGTMVAIYRVMEQNWPAEQAAQELHRFGFHEVWVHLLEYLKHLDRGQINALAATRPLPAAAIVP